jgi:multidrug resistance efflux pump
MPGGFVTSGRWPVLVSIGLFWALATQETLPAPRLAQQPHTPPTVPARTIRLHGVVEPVRSYTVAAPRLAAGGPGSAPGQLIVVRLARAGTFVKQGDLLVEFDRHAALNAARDREADYRESVEQVVKRRSEHRSAAALRDSQLQKALNDHRIAALDVEAQELVPRITAEKNGLVLAEAEAHLVQLRRTFDLRQRAEEADLRILEIQRDRALSALQHARRNAERMRVTSPHDGLVVLKSLFRGGSMAEIQEGEEVRVGVPILEVVDPSAMRVRANVNQADVDRLAPGQPAWITLDSDPARRFQGRLEQLSPIATTSSLSPRVRTFVAIFAVEGTDAHLLPDLAAAIDITPQPAPPHAALR